MCACKDGYRRFVELDTYCGVFNLLGQITTVEEAAKILRLPGYDKIVRTLTRSDGSTFDIPDISELQRTVSGDGLEYYIKIACIVSFLGKHGVELLGIKTERSFWSANLPIN